MGKQFIWIASFLTLALIGDRTAGYFCDKIVQKSGLRFSRSYFSNQSADILFVGNSRGLTFYQPEVERLTGLKTMNLSYNGMPADLAKCLVMDYLDKHAAPKIMLVDVTLCDRENDVLKSAFNLYAPYSPRLDTLLRGMRTGDDAWAGRKVVYGGKVAHLYRYNSEIFQRALYFRKGSDEATLLDRVITDAAANDTALKSYTVRMFPNMVDHLREMIDYAQAKGVEVRLVINPYYAPFAESIRDSFLTPLKLRVEEKTGKTVHDFSAILTERDELGDYQHPNVKGSAHYVGILNERGFFRLGDVESESSFFLPSNDAETPPQDTAMSVLPALSVQSETPSVFEQVKGNFGKTRIIDRPYRRAEEDFGFAVDTLFSH